MKRAIFLIIIFCLTIVHSHAQRRSISGVIKDESGVVIPGANVVVEGTTNGTVTDLDGNFSITIEPTSRSLIVSFIGYKAQTVEIGSNTKFEISLKPSNTDIDEVVIVGYGAQKKVSVVGAISNVNAKDLSTVSTPNLSNSLGGRVSGIMVKLRDGQPGHDDPEINIRGIGTINDASPLVLIDGMEGALSRVNPNDIESFSVLKDASATAVYGVRGANGVILITTKRGLVGKPQITINGQYRLQKIINYPTFLGSYDYARLYNEALYNAGIPLTYNAEDLEHYRTGDSPYTHPDVDWLDAFVAPFAPEQKYDVNLRGGTEKVKYFVSGEFLSQQGAYRQFKGMENSTNASYNRFNLRMNFDFVITKTTDLNLSLNGRIQDTRHPISGDNTTGTSPVGTFWDNIVWFAPNMTPLMNPNGSIGASGNSDNFDYAKLRTGGNTVEKSNGLKASIKLEQKLDFFTKGLSFRFMGGTNSTMDYNFILNKADATFIYNPDGTYTMARASMLPNYNINNERVTNNTYIESAISYNRTFGHHAVSGLALYNQDKIANNANAWTAHRGFAGRATYAFRDKYLAEVNVGYNGSTQFESQNRYTLLPAFSAGWVISEENFFKSTFPQINFFKLRGSYGTVGNDKIGNNQFLYLAVYNPSGGNNYYRYRFGEALNIYNGLQEASLANEDVSWEIAKKQNYGFDMEIKDGMFGLGFDYFREDRSNILAKRNTVTYVLGLATNQLPAENFGKVQNQGFEVEARFNKKIGEFKIQANGSFSKAKNKIIDIDEIKYDKVVYDYKNKTGKQIGQYFGYTWTGEFYNYEELGYVWDESVEGPIKYVLPENAAPSVPVPTVSVKPGDLKFVDRDGNGIIDDYDSGAIGKTSRPEFIYGLNYTISFKGFSLNMFWQGAGGFNAKFDGQYSREFVNNAKVNERHLDRWAYYVDPLTSELIDTRANATYPRLIIAGSTETQRSSTYHLFKGDYLRLKTMELAYKLPKEVVKSAKLDNVSVFLTGSNLLTFSKVKYIDPENPAGASAYPQSSFYGVGVRIGM